MFPAQIPGINPDEFSRREERGQTTHGLIKPQLERTEIELEAILRWEDDGGQMLDVGSPIDQSNPGITRELANER